MKTSSIIHRDRPGRWTEVIRWKLSLAAWWVWLKVTPDHPLKYDILDAVVSLRALYPNSKGEA